MAPLTVPILAAGSFLSSFCIRSMHSSESCYFDWISSISIVSRMIFLNS